MRRSIIVSGVVLASCTSMSLRIMRTSAPSASSGCAASMGKGALAMWPLPGLATDARRCSTANIAWLGTISRDHAGTQACAGVCEGASDCVYMHEQLGSLSLNAYEVCGYLSDRVS